MDIQTTLPFLDLTPQQAARPTRQQKAAAMRPYRSALDIQEQITSLVRELNLAYTKTDERPVIHSPADAAHILTPIMGSLDHEELYVINLDIRNRILRLVRLYVGSANSSQVRLAEIFRQAIIDNAPAIVVAHNHPSGEPSPSPEDVSITHAIVQAGKLLDIEVLDHLVIARDRFVSLKERGLGFN